MNVKALGQNTNGGHLLLDTLAVDTTIRGRDIPKLYKSTIKTGLPGVLLVSMKKGSVDLMLKKAGNDKWSVYKLPVSEYYLNRLGDTLLNAGFQLKGVFIIYTNSADSGQSGVMARREDEFIVDIKRNTYIRLTAFDHFETYAKEPIRRKGESNTNFEKRVAQVQDPYTEINNQVTFDGTYLSLKPVFEKNGVKYYPPFNKNLATDDNEPLDLGGVYKYIDGVFVKIKTYKWGFKGLHVVK